MQRRLNSLRAKEVNSKKRKLTLQTELEELDRTICKSTNMDLDQDAVGAYDAAKDDTSSEIRKQRNKFYVVILVLNQKLR